MLLTAYLQLHCADCPVTFTDLLIHFSDLFVRKIGLLTVFGRACSQLYVATRCSLPIMP